MREHSLIGTIGLVDRGRKQRVSGGEAGRNDGKEA
jgi:hypothetical protein